MKGILGDVNIHGQLRILLYLLESDSWKEIWECVNISVQTLADVNLPLNASDKLIWQKCQQEELVLITNNRNADGADSLEETIRLHSTLECLPVFTFSDAEKISQSRDYAERVVEKMLEYLLDIDTYRGAGRLFLP